MRSLSRGEAASRRLVWLASVVALYPLCAAAQPAANARSCRDASSDAARAASYAPRLIFHESERYFPTVPFFTAFFDNEGERRADAFVDPDAIAPLSDKPTKASWSQLRTSYDAIIDRWRGGESRRPPMTAAFYRVRHDVDERKVWGFLRSDGQAWRRNDMDALLSRLPESTEFVAVEYYFYSIRDVGLRGHPEDIEFVFIFMPRDPALACELLVIVGAGHEPRQPNNVLVVTRSPSERGSARATGLIVELGGHASAPDVDNDGAFVLGHDINWGLENVWGVRDLLAVAGAGFTGDYHSDMTLPRTDEWYRVPPRTAFTPSGYALIPVSALEQLEGHLLNNRGRVGSSLKEYADYVGVALPPLPLGPDQMSRLLLWTRDLQGGGSGHQFWEHDHYKADAHHILKQHVYRRWSWWRNWVVVYEVARDNGSPVRFGARFPTPSILGLNMPGILEPTVGVQNDRTSIELLYEGSFADIITWFVGIRWDDRRFGLGRRRSVDRRSFWLSAGPSLVLYVADRPRWYNVGTLIGGLRLRTGPTVDVHQIANGIREVGWTLSVAVR